MLNKILFIFEGEKTEKQIANNLKKYFISENSIVQSAYCSNIYKLYNEISEDEDLDTFILLKELPCNKEILADFNRNDFAEIYMFFDYDGHDTFANDEIVTKLLDFFDEETFAGKLFLSYPMDEALKHISDSVDFRQAKVLAKENIKYKQIVNRESKNEYKHLSRYTKDIWIQLIEIHLKKMNYIVNHSFSLPTENISQYRVFLWQLKKYIKIDSTVAVLSSFPVFLFDYYGYEFIKRLLSVSNNK